MYDAAKFGQCCAEHGLPNILEESLKENQLDNHGQDTLTLAEVQDEVTHKGFELFNPSDNGDCFYECLSWLLDGKKSIEQLRVEAGFLINENPSMVNLESWAKDLEARGPNNPYINQNGQVMSIKEYIEEVMFGKMWADDNVIDLMSNQLLKSNIVPLLRKEDFTEEFRNDLRRKTDTKFVLYLPGKKHFVAFRRKPLYDSESQPIFVAQPSHIPQSSTQLSPERRPLPVPYTSPKSSTLPLRKRDRITRLFKRIFSPAPLNSYRVSLISS